MEVMCHAEFATDPLPYEVSPDATAAQVLRDVCALFGREEKDMALEVDGVEVCRAAERMWRSAVWGCTRTAGLL